MGTRKGDSRREGQIGHRPTRKITCPMVGHGCPPSSARRVLATETHPSPLAERQHIKAWLGKPTSPAMEGEQAMAWAGSLTSPGVERSRPRLGPGEPVPCVSLLIPRCITVHAIAAAAGCDTHTLRSFSSMPFIFSMALSAASWVSKCTKA